MPQTTQTLPMISAPLRPGSRHGRITAVSMMKDEGPYVLEWVAHHLAVGFTDLVVYTNDCTDGTDDMLIRLEELGLAHHRRNRIAPGIKPQPSAIRHAQADPLVQRSDWVLVFDADEFLCIRHGDGTLDGVIDGILAADASGMVITWRIFGSGGVRDWSRDFVTEQYLMAAPPMWNKGWGVKTLFRFEPENWKLGIHRPKMKNRVLDTDYPHSITWLNGSGRRMEDYFKFRGWRSIVRTVGYDWAQMNHYAVKSMDSYAIRKARGNVNDKADKYNAAYWALQDRNEVRDDTMLRYSAGRGEIFQAMLSDPVLNRLHHAALDRAEGLLAAFKASGDYAGFVESLAAASRIPITRVEARPPKPRDAQAIAARMKNVEKRAALRRTEAKEDPAGPGLPPVDIYVRGPVDMAEAPALEWHANHTVELPADPRLFTPPALLQICAGKFERNLARNLPQMLPADGRFLDVGAGSGFLGTHLSRVRPDAHVTLQENDPGRRTFIARLWARNGVAAGPRLDLTPEDLTDPAMLKARLRAMPPDILVLGAPEVTRDAIGQVVGALDRRPACLLVTGRLLAEIHPDLGGWQDTLAAHGYAPRAGLDPLAAAGFSLSGTG